MTEAEIQSLILLEASKCGHRLFRSNAGSIETKNGRWVKLFPKGFPDTLGWRKSDGKFIAIEIKKPKGRLSKHQKKFAEFAENQPIIYGVARNVDDAMEIINNG